MDNQQYEAAIRMYQYCINENPNNNKAYCNLGTAYKLIGNYQAAKNAYQCALQMSNKDPMVNYNLGNL